MGVSRVIQCLDEPVDSTRPMRVPPPVRACQPAVRRGTREAEPHPVILSLRAERAEDVLGGRPVRGQIIACKLGQRHASGQFPGRADEPLV